MKRGSVDARRSRAWANRHTVYREYGGLDLAPSQLFDSCINFAGGYRQLLVSHISCSFLKHDRIVFDVEIVITQKRDINFLIQSRRRPFSPLGDQWRSPTIAGLSHSVAIPSENLVAGVAKSLCDDRHWPVSRSLIRPSCGFHERNPPPPTWGARWRRLLLSISQRCNNNQGRGGQCQKENRSQSRNRMLTKEGHDGRQY